MKEEKKFSIRIEPLEYWKDAIEIPIKGVADFIAVEYPDGSFEKIYIPSKPPEDVKGFSR